MERTSGTAEGEGEIKVLPSKNPNDILSPFNLRNPKMLGFYPISVQATQYIHRTHVCTHANPSISIFVPPHHHVIIL